MNSSTRQTYQLVLDALNFSNSNIRQYLAQKDIEEMKTILRHFDSLDLHILSSIAIEYEEYEVCQSIKDIFNERTLITGIAHA